jgi:hydrogenase-4 component E
VARLIDPVLVALVITDLWLLGSSRMAACIRTAAAQGLLLGVLTIIVQEDPLAPHILLVASMSTVLKAVVFPRLLGWALREAEVRREVEPIGGFTTSILLGVAALGVSLWLGSRLPLPVPVASDLVVPVALFTSLCGLLLILTRRKALSQVLGYLVLENGIYAFGVALALREPLVVELGVLLDVFVAVFVMGITIFQINRGFDHIDTDRLDELKDWRR